MSDVLTPAESSPAVVPTDPEAYARWRQTGELSAPGKPKEDSTPSHDPSAAAEEAARNTAPASEAGPSKQEPPRAAKPRSDAASRLTELLEDLKNAGLTPAELKTFRKSAAVEPPAAETKSARPATEQTAEPKAPAKPQIGDFDDYAKYEKALEDWHEAMADYRVEKKLREYEAQRAQEASQRETQQKLDQAKQRYGVEAETTIRSAAKEILNDPAIVPPIKALISDSPVIADLMYVLGTGTKGDTLEDFVALSKSDPGAAIRKLVLLEHLVSQELTHQPVKAAEKPAAVSEPARGEDGKFVASGKPPAKPVTQAPPPPKEAGGAAAAPPDEVESAAKTGDFRTFRSAANRRDLAQRQGR